MEHFPFPFRVRFSGARFDCPIFSLIPSSEHFSLPRPSSSSPPSLRECSREFEPVCVCVVCVRARARVAIGRRRRRKFDGVCAKLEEETRKWQQQQPATFSSSLKQSSSSSRKSFGSHHRSSSSRVVRPTNTLRRVIVLHTPGRRIPYPPRFVGGHPGESSSSRTSQPFRWR